jgi:hypothetical protein
MTASDKRRVAACKRRFREFYPGGFQDVDYVVMERLYKWDAHRSWVRSLGPDTLSSMVRSGQEADAATTAIRIESRTNLLFSFEKMAVRDAVSLPEGAKSLATGLHDWLHGRGSEKARFERWCRTVAELPRRQTRVATWPVVTVFGFVARPRTHIFLKPTVTRVAAERYGFEFDYQSRPNWDTYSSLTDFAKAIRTDLADWHPRDMIDIQSFIWVLGSSEYD